MRFDLKTRRRLVLSELQYAVMRTFYNNGPNWKMPLIEWATIPGNTLNSLLDKESPILKICRGYEMEMTTDGHNYIARYEGKDPFRDHVSRQFCQQVRLTRGFRLAHQKTLLADAQERLQAQREKLQSNALRNSHTYKYKNTKQKMASAAA